MAPSIPMTSVFACLVPDGSPAYAAPGAPESWAWATVVASGSATAATVAAASTVRAERDRDT
ncbi:hypothetical protein AB0E67_14200 [Streptomyces sp. NPDC032161]|uniref:hypothetical protein n=1 Tax=unclassified Streptomyces TaxID=2593676 RepID=UPI0033F696D3